MFEIFSSPEFQDKDLYRKDKIFYSFVLGTAVIVSVLQIIQCFIMPQNYLRWLIVLSVFDIVSIFLLFLRRWGYRKIASFTFVTLIMGIIFTLSFTSGGIMSTSFRFIPVLVLGAGFFLGTREGIFVGIISLVGGFLLVLADSFHLLPGSIVVQTPWNIFFNFAALIAILILLEYVTVESLNSALQRAEKNLQLLIKKEEELRKSEKFRKTVFESSRTPIVVLDAVSLIIIDCNQAAVEIYRTSSRESTLGKSPMDFSAPTQYDGTSSSDKARFFIDKAIEEGSVVFEWKHQRPDGEIWDAEVHLMSFEIENQKCLQFTLVDITESKKMERTLRESEEKFHTLFENASDSIFLMDGEKFFDCNTSTLEIFGCDTIDQIIGHSPMEFSPELQFNGRNSFEFGREIITDALSGNKQFFEWTHKKLDGTQFPAEVRLNRIELGEKVLLQAIVRDITERKQAQEKLRDSEEQYRHMIQILPDGVVMVTDGKVQYLNDNACKFLKVKEVEKIIGTNAIEHIHPDFRDLAQKRLINLMKTKTNTEPIEVKFLTQDGNSIDVISASAYFIHRGKPSYFVVFTDVTERKQAEAALKESENRYRYLFKQNPLPMLIYELSSLKILAVNDAFVSQYGYSEAEASELLLDDLYPEEEKEPIADLITNLSGHAYAGEWHHVKKDGTKIAIEAYSHAINYEDRQARIAVINDITVRKQAEEDLLRYKNHLVEMVEERTSELEESRETFRALAENTKDVIARVNEKMEFLYMNSAMKDVFDIPIYKYLGKTLAELNFPQNLVDGLERIIKNVFESKQNLQTEFQLQNGIWADLRAVPEFDMKSNVISVIISARDITKSKNLQQEIQESLEKEKELNQLKNRFISMVSHEYRTPLTSILSSIEILEMKEETYTKEKKKTHFNRIQKNIDYLVEMIDEVLYVNRIDSNRVDVALKSVNIKKFCTELFDEIKELYPEIKSFIEIDLKEVQYKIDEAILKKILVNLITNAYKYNKENGEVKFIINSEMDKLIFKISDTGIGIPENEQKNVFEPFLRMSNTQNIKGTGLGLNIVKKSVEQLDGKVLFTSIKDEGTTFTVSIPIQ